MGSTFGTFGGLRDVMLSDNEHLGDFSTGQQAFRKGVFGALNGLGGQQQNTQQGGDNSQWDPNYFMPGRRKQNPYFNPFGGGNE
jgi:hypothetical protein